MTNNPNSINSIESNANTSKSSKFVENTKRAVRKVLATSRIVAGSMLPINTSTALPVSANKIIHIEPTTSTTIKTVWQWTTANLLTAFEEKDNEASNQENLENNNIEEENQSEINTTRWENQNTTENNNSNINTIGYNAIEITNINPVDILPIIWQVERWDKRCYEHIKHLRVAEATRIRDMMREYGAGNYSAEEYKQLMSRLNTGMVWETPRWYDNYESIWTMQSTSSYHAHDERNILNSLVNHANFKVVHSREGDINVLYDFAKNNENSINIFWKSMSREWSSNEWYFNIEGWETKRELLKLKNFMLFWAWTNIGRWDDWILKNKIYQENINTNDEQWIYWMASTANWKSDTDIDRHLLVTIWTNRNWDIDQTNESVESSKFPVWFHNNVLFSWRAFPYLSWSSNRIMWEAWKYATSYTNYVNVALASILFQLKADTPDTDQLLEMIKSTALTDHIKFDLNGDGDTNDNYQGQPENQPLLLINPAWFFQKYLMPTNLPTSIKTDENITLEKGYYHGVIYQIPGAEVNINGQWIPFTGDNRELIFSQNPMNLDWRLNGKTLNNYNYKPGDTISGQIIAVDDQWNGLNITKDFSVNVEDASGIDSVTISYTPNAWYTIDGIRLNEKPTKPGIYIVNGQKVIIK